MVCVRASTVVRNKADDTDDTVYPITNRIIFVSLTVAVDTIITSTGVVVLRKPVQLGRTY